MACASSSNAIASYSQFGYGCRSWQAEVMSASLPTSLAGAVEAHYEELKAFVVRRVGCPALAADIVQDVWLKAAATQPAEPVRNARAYLYRLAGNLAVDRLRAEIGHTRHVLTGALPEWIPSAAPPADLVLQSQQELGILRDAVLELPERCRAVFLLYKGQGMTMRQVATALGISEKTVEKHIAKAMVHCRNRLRAAGRRV
jgi:RNA polymerase sigma factor (sigma-70 family)